MSHRNLACMWANFRQAGADRLILVRLVDNENRPATVVAEDVLHRIGWLHRAGAQ